MIPFFHHSIDFSAGLAFRVAFALVMELFALAEAELYFYPAVLEVQRQRDQSHTVLHDTGLELHDLPLMHQQSARPNRIPVKDIAVLIRTDVHPAGKQLSVLDRTEAVLEVDLPGTYGLHLRTGQLDPRFKAFQDKIFMKGFAVIRNLLDAQLLWQDRSPLSRVSYHTGIKLKRVFSTAEMPSYSGRSSKAFSRRQIVYFPSGLCGA